MSKYATPTILTSIVLLAGMFAFMPVEQASTVHTTIQGTQATLAVDTFDATAVEIDDNDEFEITSTADFCLISLTIELVAVDNTDVLNVDDIQINDVPLASTALGAVLTADFLTDPGQAATGLQEVFLDADFSDKNGLCAEANEVIEMSIEETGIAAGEVTEVLATAIVDGNVAITVTVVEN